MFRENKNIVLIKKNQFILLTTHFMGNFSFFHFLFQFNKCSKRLISTQIQLIYFLRNFDRPKVIFKQATFAQKRPHTLYEFIFLLLTNVQKFFNIFRNFYLWAKQVM